MANETPLLNPRGPVQERHPPTLSPLGTSSIKPKKPKGIDADQEKALFQHTVDTMLIHHQKGTREREILRDINYMSTTGLGTINPNDNFDFEGSKGNLAEMRRQDYLRNDPEAGMIQPDKDILSTSDTDSGDPGNAFRSTVNFLFSDEMGMLGMKWDQEGFAWALGNAKQQFAEHPYSSAFTLASYMVPIGLAWQKGARVAARGAKLATMAGAGPEIAKGTGVLGTTVKLGFKFDDHAAMVQQLARPDVNGGRGLFSKSTIDRLAQPGIGPDEIAKIVPPRELNKMLIGDFHQERYAELRQLAKNGELEGIQQKASWVMWNQFGNKYFEKLNDVSKANIESMDDFFTKAQLGRFLAQAPTRLSHDSNKAIYKFWLDGPGRNKDALGKKIGADNADWASEIADKWTQLFDEQVAEGFVDDATAAMFRDADKVGSGFHVPAVKVGTPGFENLGGTASGLKSNPAGKLGGNPYVDDAAAMSGPTTMHRGKLDTKEAVIDAIDSLEVAPDKMTVGGFIKDNVLFQLHRNFRDIIVDATDNPASKWSQMVKPRARYDELPDAAKKHWIAFDELDSVVPGLSARMERMVRKEADLKGMDPKKFKDMAVIDREVLQQFFGQDGSAKEAAGTFGKFFELLTAVHKTARTSLNVPTHMSNIMGNMMFLAMAGMNPFSRVALNDGKVMSGALKRIIKTTGKEGGESIESIMGDPAKLAKALGKDRYITDHLGEKVDLSEIFSNPAIMDMIEAQSFETQEGMKNVNYMLEQLDKLNSDHWGDKALATVARSIAGVGNVRGIKQTMSTMSHMYLAEDAIPKMMYVSHLARKGYGIDAIVREVGRRLPQYRTVGTLQQSARKVVLPWVTFPAEAARIMKNNMMDRPVPMMAWMQAPQIAQAAVSGMGMGPDFSDYTDAINAAPAWAVRYQTVMLNGNDAPEFLGAAGAGGMGAMAGAAIGGAKGAAIGGAAGAAAGALMGNKFGQSPVDEVREFNRAWVMDFLPQSALFPASLHPHEWEKLLPTGMTGGSPTPGKEWLQTAKDLTPVEPFAVFQPILDLYSGRGSFGTEIEAKSGIAFANKMALGLLGHLAPPIMQKYGMKLPNGNAFVPMADAFTKNGGQMTLPKYVTSTFGGLALAGLTFMGSKGHMAGKAGQALLSAKGSVGAATALSGTMGAMAGAEINTTRLMTDLGILADTRTGQKGDMTLDFMANSWFGLNKSWKSSAEQNIYNESLRSKRFAEMRKVPVKGLRDAIAQGSESRAKSAIGEIYKLYGLEHANTEVAMSEYMKWAQRTSKSMEGLKIYQGLSEDRIMGQMQALRAGNAEKSKINRQTLAELRTELEQRQLRKAGGLTVVEQP